MKQPLWHLLDLVTLKVCWRDQALGECYSSKGDLGCSTHQEQILCEASCCCKQCSFERWVEKKSHLSWESLNCVGLDAWAADKQLLQCCGTWFTSYMSLSWLARQVRNKAGITLGRESKKLASDFSSGLVCSAENARTLAGPFRSASITEPGVAPSYCSAKVVCVSLNSGPQIHPDGTGLEQQMWN